MRLSVAVILLAACAPDPTTRPVPIGDPDASVINCESGSFAFVAPVAGQHYDPTSVVATVHVGTFYAQNELGTEVYDDAQNVVQPMAAPELTDLGNGETSATWQFSGLEPATRYTWYVWALECDQTETFFTD